MRYPKYWIKIKEKYVFFCAELCHRCDMLIKKETIWKVKSNHLTNCRASAGDWLNIEPIYYCKKCFQNKEDLIDWVAPISEKYNII